nr:GTPase ObgE [Desulfobacterales bacterium]
MKFVDEVVIHVESGDGGNGCVSFRREKFIPKGGPDGGDGGKGGDVIFKCSSQRYTLFQFLFRSNFKAKSGSHGQGKNKKGKKGDDVIIEVPPGTLLKEAESGRILKDFIKPGEFFLALKGGRGGRGNKYFASSTNRAPRYAQKGEKGKKLSLKLELKLLADVGIVGLPNAGKSTLISRLSSAHPKIADYPFTTLSPTIGVVNKDEETRFTIADIPGLIEGANQGAGLGTRFLRHVERTRLLLHLIDISHGDLDQIIDSYHTVNNEIKEFNIKVLEKPQVVVLNKIDIDAGRRVAEKAKDTMREFNPDVWTISALTGEGLKPLKEYLGLLVEKARQKKFQF